MISQEKYIQEFSKAKEAAYKLFSSNADLNNEHANAQILNFLGVAKEYAREIQYTAEIQITQVESNIDTLLIYLDSTEKEKLLSLAIKTLENILRYSGIEFQS